jgi:broad specificity phosphatase PhoE
VTRLVLVRHAETASNAVGRSQGRADHALTDLGRRQAVGLVPALLAFEPRAIYSSPASRALQTAAPFATAVGLAPIVDERLHELDHGELDGLTGAEMRAAAPEFMRAWSDGDPSDLRLPGGETLAEAQGRMTAAVSVIASEVGEGTAVVFSHNLALRALLCGVLGVPLSGFRRFRTELAGYTVVHAEVDEAGETRWWVSVLNERCHLEGAGLLQR